MRTIEYVKINDVEKQLVIEADERNEFGASHNYEIKIGTEGPTVAKMQFQNGPIAEHGVNGMTNESLLAIVIDRLEGFLAGKFPSRETALAKTKLEEALMWLNKRTLDRQSRGVEGQYKA